PTSAARCGSTTSASCRRTAWSWSCRPTTSPAAGSSTATSKTDNSLSPAAPPLRGRGGSTPPDAEAGAPGRMLIVRGPHGPGTVGEQTYRTTKENRDMARLAGVDLPRDKRMEIALTYIFGIGRTRAVEILERTGISTDLRSKDLTDEQLTVLRDDIEGNYKVEGDLRREVQGDIRRTIEIGAYQGLRHRRGLPVHGQRTKTNARTRKGPKKTVAGKRK